MAPARSPTRPPNDSILWVAGWASGPVPLFQDSANFLQQTGRARLDEIEGMAKSVMVAVIRVRDVRGFHLGRIIEQ